MAEPVELRVVLTDDGANASATGSTPAPATPALTPPPAPTPTSLRPNADLDAAMAGVPPPPLPPPTATAPAPDDFDPVAEAHAQLDREERRRQVEEARRDLLREQGKLADEAEAAFDPVAEAQKRLEAMQRRNQVEAAIQNQIEGPATAIDMTPTAEAVFDPQHEARQRLEAERRKKQTQAAYENLTQGPADVQAPGFKLPPVIADAAGVAGYGGAVKAVEGIATAAGPAGIALGAVALASHQAAQQFDAMRQTVEQVGQGMVQLAGNDYMGMFQTGVDMAASSLEKIPIVGQVFAAELKLATAPVIAFNRVVEAFVHRGQQLAMWSPALTEANVRADMRSMLGDIQEAERLGPGIARLTDAQSQLSDELRELFLPIKEFVIEVLAPFLELFKDLLFFFRAGIQTIGMDVAAAVELMKMLSPLFNAVVTLQKYTKRIRDNMEEEKNKAVDELLDPEAILGDMLREVKDFARMHKPQAIPKPDGGFRNNPIFDLIQGMRP